MRFLFLCLFSISVISCSSVKNLQYVPSNLETINALKDILNSSAAQALFKISNSQNKGIEALLPEHMKPVLSTLKTLGLKDELKKIDKAVIESSSLVLAESKDLMSEAIRELKFADAANIVLGGENAATIALKNAMYSAVKNKYRERIASELQKVPETKYWDVAIKTYNTFAKNKIDSDIEDFVAERAVDTVFIAMGKEEAVIRQDPSKLGIETVTKVFDYYMNK